MKFNIYIINQQQKINLDNKDNKLENEEDKLENKEDKQIIKIVN